MKFKSAFHGFLVIWGMAMPFAPQVNAAIYYWDNNGTTYALSDGDGTSGTWSGVLDAGNTFAIVPSSGILDGATALVSLSTAATKSTDSIYFGTNHLSLGATASTIGTTGIININNIVFGAGQTNAVTLGSGGTIRLVGGSPTITVNNASDTIAAVLDGSLGFTKSGGGTLILSGVNTISGGVSINSGTLQIGDGTSGSLAAQDAQDLNFNGTGVFNVVGASAGDTAQSMAYLTFNAGDGTVQSTRGGNGTATLTLADISSIALGATANFVTSGGNSTNNRITIDSASQYAQFSNSYFLKNIFFNGSSYAAYDSGGFLRAVGAGDINFATVGAGVDMGTRLDTETVLLTGSLSAQGSTSVSSINLGANNITLSGPTALLQTDGLLSSGSGSATIAGGKLKTTTAGTDMVIRVNGASDQLTISSNIEDNAGSMLTKSGAGTLVLSGTNTYSGTTTINAGTLAVSGGNGIADTGAVAMVNTTGASLRLDSNETIGSLYGGGFAGGNVNVQGNTLTIANAASQTFGGTINGTSGGGLTLSNGGLTLSNKNSFAGTITLLGNSQLTFAYGNDGTSDTPTVSSGGSILMADGTSLQVNPTAQVANGVAYGVLGGAATRGLIYSNDIVITSGTASIKQLSTSTGGRYIFSGSVTGGTSGAQTLSLVQGAGGGAAQKATMTMSGVIQNGSGGTLGVNVGFLSAQNTSQGAYICLSGQNTFTGPIAVSNTYGLVYTSPASQNGGWLVIGGEITANTTDRTVTTGWGYLGGGNYTNTISLATGTVLDYASSANQTLGGVISGGGALVKEGFGILTLGAANTYTGGTNVLAGTLLVSGANNLPTSGALTVGTGGTFSLADGTARTTTGASSGVGLTLSTGSVMAFDWNGASLDSLALSGTATASSTGSVGIIINNLSSTGAGGTLISTVATSTLNAASYFTANNTNYTANITKAANSVSIGSYAAATALTNAYWKRNQVAGATDTMAFSLGTLSNWASDAAGTSAGGVVPGGSGVNVIFGSTSASSAVTVGANMNLGSITFNDTAAVTISGSNTITLNSTSSAAATTSAALSTVTAGSAISVTSFANANNTISANLILGASQTWNVASGKTLTVSGSITGSGFNLTKADGGTLVLSGVGNYSGVTTVSDGILRFNSPTALYSNNKANWTAANIKVNSGATLALTVGNSNFTNSSITTLLSNLGGLGGAVSNNGLQAGSFIGFDTSGPGASGFTVADNIADSTGTGGGAIGVTKLGNNTTLVLAGNSTYSGATTITAGTLKVGSSAALGSASNTLVFNGGNLQAGGSFTSAATRNVLMTANGTVDTNGYALGLAGAFSGAGRLTKTGLGTLTLSNTLSHTGGTTVSAGTLLLSGANNLPTSGTLTVSAGSTFSLADGAVRNTTAATLTLTSGCFLGFDWSSAGTVDNLASTVAIAPSAGAVVGIIINPIGTPTGGGNLLTGITGSTLNNPNYFLVNNTNFTAIITKPGAGAGSVSIGSYAAATALTDAYWKGGLTNAVGTMAFSSGTASNWVSSVGGTTTGVVPGGSAVNVIFGATGASNQSAVTTGADMNLGSITFNDTTAVTIAGGTITLNSSSSTAASTSGALSTVTAGSAISVTSFASATNTISASLALAANQTWNVASGKNLAVSGIISGEKSLTKADAGILTLSGANTFSGGLVIKGGTVSINTAASVNALSSGVVTIGDAANTGAAATLQFHGAGNFPTFTNDLYVTGNGTAIIGATAYNPIFGGNLVLANDLTIASNNGLGSTLTFNGGVTGTGNITVSIGNTSNASLVTFGAAEVNNAGTLTYNNAAVTIGSTTGVAGTGAGTNLITGGVGSNVTAITQGSNSNALTIQTNALTVNSGGTTLNATGTAKLTVSGGVAGTGNLILNTNHNTAANGITLMTAAVNNLGTVTNSGTGTAGTVINSVIDYNVTGVIQNSATSSLTLTANNTYTGATTVTSGSMIINGSVASSSVVVDGSLSGTGTLTNATLSGSGAINPGSGAGIMTAALIDPTDGLDFNFEFTAANTLPTWNAPTASVNDVLRLTDLFNPIVVPMNGTNLISLYLNVASLTVGNMFTGGFYTDKNASFQTAIAGANYQYYLANANGAITYNGNKYDLYTGLLAFTVSTVQQTANFSNPSSTGYVTQFTVINGPYLQWVGGGGGFSSDDNGDGIANGLAWLLGASGPNVNARSKLPTLTTSSGDIHLNFSVLNSSSRGYATIKVQYSKDMGVTDSWTSHEAAVPDVTSTVNGVSFIVIPNGNSNNVEAVIPASAAGTGKKLFTRLVSNMP